MASGYHVEQADPDKHRNLNFKAYHDNIANNDNISI